MSPRTSESVSDHSDCSLSIPITFEISKKIASSKTASKMYDQVIDKLEILQWSIPQINYSCLKLLALVTLFVVFSPPPG